MKASRLQISLSKSLYIYFAIVLLIIPLRLLFAALISAAVHELFHIAAIRMMNVELYAVRIGIRGAQIETAPMTDKQELLCALSGPIGGFLLLLSFRWTPVIALVGTVQSLYNLFPLYPTDGGRALKCGLKLIFPEKIALRVMRITEILALSTVIAFCCYGSLFLRLGIIPLIFAAAVLLQSAKRK